jgi:excisionase family DNA binding protein
MERLLLKPGEVTEMLSMGRSRIYEMLNTGELPSIRIGRSIRIPAIALKEWVDTHQSGGDKETTPL